ncbi:nuclear receptor subfamily 2 group F member 6-like [Schistocerca nitens]|uniref:nuclear receptor subfamily 2 group F member 6-like n=1 Tax=Schistocerca nitens TaxID=7011 RepID=UPI002118CFEB|nr:nuclear receptor subfamily 2 group F member 6-like [Schistocerca nitens]
MELRTAGGGGGASTSPSSASPSPSGRPGEALCRVCGDKASGKHYGVPSCDGCRGFFKRSIRRNLDYVCKEAGRCVVDVSRRNQCQACRFNKCLQVNMKKDALKHPPPQPPPQLTLDPGLLYPALALPTHHVFTQQHAGLPVHLLPLLQPPTPLVGVSPGSISAAHGVHHVPPTAPVCPSTTGSTCGGGASSNEDEVTSSEEAGRHDKEAVASPSRQPLELSSLTLLPAESVYESAAKLLFLGVKWARGVPSFLQLPARDQALLLEEAWGELFVLSAAQWELPLDEGCLISLTLSPAPRRQSLEAEACRLRETLSRCAQLRVDHTEYACLKALVLFKPECPGLSARAHVQLLQDQTLAMLLDYCGGGAGGGGRRFGRLLLLLPAAQAPTRHALEDLFFRRTVGDVSIRALLRDMLDETRADRH